jgi:hypothetical protein
MISIKRFVACITIFACLGCASPKPAADNGTNSQRCWVVYAKQKDGGKVIGPMYSKNRPTTSYSTGDVSFLNMETNRNIMVPSADWTIKVMEGFYSSR